MAIFGAFGEDSTPILSNPTTATDRMLRKEDQGSDGPEPIDFSGSDLDAGGSGL